MSARTILLACLFFATPRGTVAQERPGLPHSGAGDPAPLLPHVEMSVEELRMDGRDVPAQEAVQHQIRSRVAIVRTCITRNADAMPQAGSVTVRFVVAPDGRPTEIELRDARGPLEGSVAQCIDGQYVRRLRFPEDAQMRIDVTLRYTMPDRPDEATVLRAEADTARAEARSARARGRCMVAAARALGAAGEALRASRGHARERARERVAAARAQLAGCTLLDSLTNRATGSSGAGTGASTGAGLLGGED